MATANLNLPISFTQLFELVRQLPSEKKQKLFKSLGNDLINEPNLPVDVKKLLNERLKYFKSGKAKTFTLEQTLKMLDEK